MNEKRQTSSNGGGGSGGDEKETQEKNDEEQPSDRERWRREEDEDGYLAGRDRRRGGQGLYERKALELLGRNVPQKMKRKLPKSMRKRARGWGGALRKKKLS